MTPATVDQLAALAAQLGTTSPARMASVLDTCEVHAETVQGRRTDEAFGRYCRTALPSLLRRLLDAETQLATVRAAAAQHVAAADRGLDPAPTDLFYDLRRAGIDLLDDVEAAGGLLDAQVLAAAIG
jgi:hypothetical protein